MKSVKEACDQIAKGSYHLSRHAFVRAVERNISAQEMREAGAAAELIEDYPLDKYGPTALLLGFTALVRPLHFQISLLEGPMVNIITLYEPSREEWIEFRKRR